MGGVTTHVLDTAVIRRAKAVRSELYRLMNERTFLCNTATNDDGGCDAPLLDLGAFQTGTYEWIFHSSAHRAT